MKKPSHRTDQIGRTTRVFMLLLSTSVILSYHLLAEAANKNSTAQGGTWDSIKRLPDWSGVWALDFEGHTLAGKESGSLDQYVFFPGLEKLLSPQAIQRIKNADDVPLTPKYKELWTRSAGRPAKDNLGQCLPAGVPGVMLHTIKMEFLFTPGRVTLLTENGEVRRIYTDGRAHSKLEEIGPSFEGESIGHWEGKTLVVDTTGFPSGELFQNFAMRGTKNTHYVERISLRDKDHMQIASVISDPEIFTKPYAMTRVYERLDDQMTEPQCSQTSHDRGDGPVDLTPPPEQ